MSIKISTGFILEQAQKLSRKLKSAKPTELLKDVNVPPGHAPGEVIDRVLEFLKRDDPRELGEIATHMGVREAEAGEILDHMEKAGLIKKVFRITESGMGFLELPEES